MDGRAYLSDLHSLSLVVPRSCSELQDLFLTLSSNLAFPARMWSAMVRSDSSQLWSRSASIIRICSRLMKHRVGTEEEATAAEKMELFAQTVVISATRLYLTFPPDGHGKLRFKGNTYQYPSLPAFQPPSAKLRNVSQTDTACTSRLPGRTDERARHNLRGLSHTHFLTNTPRFVTTLTGCSFQGFGTLRV